MNFIIKQSKEKGIKLGLLSVFIDCINFLNNSSDNLVENLEAIDFYYLSQQIIANVLDLLKKKTFFPINTQRKLTHQR